MMRARPHLALVVTALAAAACSGCPSSPHDSAASAPPSRPAVEYEVAEPIYDGGIAAGWTDVGWAKREAAGPGPARVDFSDGSGWGLAKPGLKGRFGALVFRMKRPVGEGDFLEVRLDSTDKHVFPRVKVAAQYTRALDDGWVEVLIPIEALDPDNAPFDRVVLNTFRPVTPAWTLVDGIGFTRGEAADGGSYASPLVAATAKPVTMAIDCRATATRISPWIYGIGYYANEDDKAAQQWTMGATIRRWGGNTTSRYNLDLAAWNTANDWFYENVSVKPFSTVAKDDASHGLATAFTVPMIGWVAKDTSSFGFPVSVYGAQQQTDAQWRPDAGNGKNPGGKLLTPGPPTRTSVAAPPELVKRWVEGLRADDAKTGKRTVVQYILDNEPALWSSTHRDVHPDPLGYDELVERTIAYGSAVRAADPDAVIAGPAEWGWLNVIASGKDIAQGGLSLRSDRRAHGDVPLLAWYLRKLKEHDEKTGVRVLDVVDVHFYPQGKGLGIASVGDTDPTTAALRIRSTRALWDPDYVDESWIKDTLEPKVALIAHLKQWIAANYPGRGISIGEWNYGAETHMSGGLATAETLGRFGTEGLTSAFYWTVPAAGSPAYYAFRAYRDFDGKGGKFLDWSIGATPAPMTSLFASRDDAGKHLVAVLLNFSPTEAVAASVDLHGCSAVESARAFGYRGKGDGFSQVDAAAAAPVRTVLPPYSITVLDLTLVQPMPGTLAK